LLLQVPKQLPFDNNRVDIDYSLVDEGIIVTDEYFSVVLDGTVHMVN
jgi:hypothetical protein